MIEVRGFTGKLNLDDNSYRVPKDDYVDALNITRDAQGHGQDLVLSNIPGNQNTLGLYTTVNQTSYGQSMVGLYGTTTAVTTIECYIYDVGSSSNVLVSSITAQANTSSFDVGFLLYFNANPLSGMTYSYGENGFYLIYNGASYTAPSLKVNGVFIGYGYNKVIGSYADKIKNRIYYFIWNEGNHDKIMYYDETQNTIYTLMENIKDTGGVDVLNFNPSYRINHIDIVYREEGDLLFWTDGLNAPRKINVQKAILPENAGGYGVILDSYLNVIKAPPTTPPQCVYEDNPGIVINNLQNKQFKFKYRFVYDDLEKSVTSAQSEVPIPKNYTAQATISQAYLNSSIFLTLETGPKNVTAIEVLGAESLGVNYSDFFLITVLNKADLNIPNNDFIGYKFFNDQAYNTIPLDESIQPFDNVPQQAFTQSLPNGNVLTYGAITEGYDLLVPNYTASINSSSKYWTRTTQTALLFINDTINYVGTYGAGVQMIVKGTPNIGDQYTFYVLVNGTFTIVTFTTTTEVTADLITGLRADAVSKGISVVTLTNGYTLLYKPSGTVTKWLQPNILPASSSPTANSYLAYDWSSRYAFGVVYFDENGRTNGVITSNTSVLETPKYSVDGIPRIEFSINSLPPSWARYFEIVRTKNLSKSNFIYWISSGTFKDETTSPLGYQYAYISLNSLYQYIKDNPDIKTLGYEFTPGDRIRFCALYDDTNGSLTRTYDDKDYEILDAISTPTINGVTVTNAGLYLKIALPLVDANFDFGSGYQNYMIQAYTPAPNFSNDTNLYYEFGERYEIGNPGTATAYHKGSLQNQIVSGGTSTASAIYAFYKGDYYFRTRRYNKGGKAEFIVPPEQTSQEGSTTIAWTISTQMQSNSFSDARFYLHSNDSLYYNLQQGGVGFPIANFEKYNFLVLNGDYAITFRIKGSITLYNSWGQDRPISFGFYQENNVPAPNHGVNGLYLYRSPGTTVPSGYSATVDFDFTFTTNPLLHYGNLIIYTASGSNCHFSIESINQATNSIIDPNFSDNYDSSASVNGRAWKVDANAENSYNPGLIRFGGEYQAGTTINNINRFYEADFDVYDRSRGDIKKMFIEGRKLYVFQQFDVGVVTVLTQIVKDTAGNPLSAQSNTLLNKIVYPYIGGYGIGNVPESFAYGKHTKYFVDNNKGVVCRLAENGITPLSIVYKTNAYFVAQLAAYNEVTNAIPPITGRPTVYGGFDAYTNKYVIALEEVRNQSGALVQNASTLCFLETNGPSEGFETFLSYHPEAINGLNNLLVTFKNGAIWTHNNQTYNKFYGNIFSSSIDVVFNDSQLDKKTYLALMQTANAPWSVPYIVSQLNSYGSTPQQTALVEGRFTLLEGQYYSAILRDINSPGGLINGDTIHGNYLIVKLEKPLATNFYYINAISLKYINSPLNLR